MTDGLESAVRVLLIGVGATAVLDIWSLLMKRFFGTPLPDLGRVGRWFGYFPRGRFVHDNIAAAAPISGELAIGWFAHYAIGIAFAAVLLALYGLEWARHPTLLPALIVGLATVAAPFFVMQPGMGAGIAASKTPNPAQARLRGIINHTVFGFGLYISAVLTAMLVGA